MPPVTMSASPKLPMSCEWMFTRAFHWFHWYPTPAPTPNLTLFELPEAPPIVALVIRSNMPSSAAANGSWPEDRVASFLRRRHRTLTSTPEANTDPVRLAIRKLNTEEDL